MNNYTDKDNDDRFETYKRVDRIQQLEFALITLLSETFRVADVYKNEKLSQSTIDAQALYAQNIRDYISGILKEGDK